jgi:selenocysteine lyase/cysteine desulfurase
MPSLVCVLWIIAASIACATPARAQTSTGTAGAAGQADAPSASAAYADFVRRHPAWTTTAVLDQLRASDFARLDQTHQVYLDYTGGNLYALRQVTQHQRDLQENVYGNPHSANPSSQASTDQVERTRDAILDYFRASHDEYELIFTANASGALRLVGESYPFTPESRLLLSTDNHNSVLGIGEFALADKAAVDYIPLQREDLRLDTGALADKLAQGRPGARNLLAYPAQSNFSGVKHPLELIEQAHAAGWDVLLDAAAFVPSNRLDLSRWKPDFVCVSFYKMFGYPTGVGCLLVRKESLERMRRPWFAGGTVEVSSVAARTHVMRRDTAAFEDGTIDYLSIPAVANGLRLMDEVGIDTIRTRVECLTGWLLETMPTLRHSNGAPLVKVHGPKSLGTRGGTVSFTLLDANGKVIDVAVAGALASKAGISLRTGGCFCNPGAGESAFGLQLADIKAVLDAFAKDSNANVRDEMFEQHGIHVLRASFGWASNFADAQALVTFLRGFLDRTADQIGHAPETSRAPESP